MFLIAAAALAAAVIPSYSRAQSEPSPLPLLDVPYLPQSEALCGAAAIAMVMRYWGVSGVYAETFADLVDPEAGGIRGHDLMRALEERGFEATSFEGDTTRVQTALANRAPLVALIEDRPGRLHYVVIVGLRGDRLVLHDPARAPYRVMAIDGFVRAWSVSDFWTLLARPAGDGAPGSSANTPERDTPRAGGVCAGMVEEGVRLAGTGDLAAAQHLLEVAAGDCSDDSAPLRELAGVYALKGEWGIAAREARRALERNPRDHHAARTLATSLFLEDRDEEALDAWNRIAAPAVDLVDIRGLSRTRFAVASSAMGLEPNTLLTRKGLLRARRRLAALPSLMASRVTYEPGEYDRAKITGAVLERPLVPTSTLQVAALGVRATTDRVVGVSVASPTGGGELWTASWRWWERRPRIAIGIAAPSPFGGIWSLEAFGERQTYGPRGSETSERRRGVVLEGADWVTGETRINAGLSIDRWDDGTTATVLGGISQAVASSGATVAFDLAWMTGARSAALMNVSGEWRSSEARVGSVWHARTGFSLAGSRAPFAVWPGAGTGHGRDVLLRAHPLLDDGVIRGVFGRRLAHAGTEWRRWRGPVFKVLHVAPALFIDLARAFAVADFGDKRTHVDAGAGMRVAIPGAGVLRIDVARGLHDGETAVSFGWTR